MSDETSPKKIHITGCGMGRITIDGLTAEEIVTIQACVSAGTHWIRVSEGRLSTHPGLEKLPDPVKDEVMLPFWRLPTREDLDTPRQMKLLEFEDLSEHGSPSIMIRHLCGYYYTPESYQENAELLLSYGFDIMRSKRSDDGKYWEVWYLPGLWSAKGEFAECIVRSRTNKENMAVAMEFLKHKLSFGTLDITIQRLAMGIPGEMD